LGVARHDVTSYEIIEAVHLVGVSMLNTDTGVSIATNSRSNAPRRE